MQSLRVNHSMEIQIHLFPPDGVGRAQHVPKHAEGQHKLGNRQFAISPGVLGFQNYKHVPRGVGLILGQILDRDEQGGQVNILSLQDILSDAGRDKVCRKNSGTSIQHTCGW